MIDETIKKGVNNCPFLKSLTWSVEKFGSFAKISWSTILTIKNRLNKYINNYN